MKLALWVFVVATAATAVAAFGTDGDSGDASSNQSLRGGTLATGDTVEVQRAGSSGAWVVGVINAINGDGMFTARTYDVLFADGNVATAVPGYQVRKYQRNELAANTEVGARGGGAGIGGGGEGEVGLAGGARPRRSSSTNTTTAQPRGQGRPGRGKLRAERHPSPPHRTFITSPDAHLPHTPTH